jgi:spore coat polysaccharide biosynthesis protein SpsF
MLCRCGFADMGTPTMPELMAVIQARMGSTRLPGKVLLPLSGETVLARVVRAARTSSVDQVVVATSTHPGDDLIAVECSRIGVPCVRGSEEDVLSRFVDVLNNRSSEAVMRLTADCPLLDPGIVRMVAEVWRSSAQIDYLSTGLIRTLPRGLDVEIVRSDVLRVVDKVATGAHRTHVTSWIYTHPDDFRIVGLNFLPFRDHLRLTLDTQEDWILVDQVVAEFGLRQPDLDELAEWLDAHPEIRDVNAAVTQKRLDEG